MCHQICGGESCHAYNVIGYTSAFVLRHNHVYRSTECFVHCSLGAHFDLKWVGPAKLRDKCLHLDKKV